MIVTSKLTAVALNVADGSRPDAASLPAEQRRKRLAAAPGLLEVGQHHNPYTSHYERFTMCSTGCILTAPGLLEFLAYALSPMAVLAGPFVEFVDYRDWAGGTGDWGR